MSVKESVDVLSEVVERVPSYRTFMTFRELEESTDALAEEYGDVVRVLGVGRSRCGEKIRAIIVGRGSKTALLFGAPHPNEPVGTLTLEYLTRVLASNEDVRKALDYTWIVVKAVDVDGLKMNEGWLKKPFTIRTYAENYYRPAGNVQIEWSFPIRYKRYQFDSPTPGTRALMNLMDTYKPDFIYSLHNAGFGGVYYYITTDAPLLYPIFQLYPKTLGVPLSLGEPEVPWARPLSKAVYRMVSVRDYYDFLESQGMDPLEVIKHGGSSFDYARELNESVVELVTEVPYLYDPRIEDLSESEITRRDAVLEAIKWRESVYTFIKNVWERAAEHVVKKDVCSETGLLVESIEYFVSTTPKAIEAERGWATTDPSLSRKAVVAEAFDSLYVTKFYSLLILGMLLRLLRRESELSSKSNLRGLLEDVEAKFEDVLRLLEEDKRYAVIDIDKLVKIQLAAGIYTALYRQLVSSS
ncbi:MAG: M14 family zinc carboxypeptidase [Nitrososphaerota archaeon]